MAAAWRPLGFGAYGLATPTPDPYRGSAGAHRVPSVRGARDFMALQQSPFFRVWASAGVAEIISALHERLVVGSLA